MSYILDDSVTLDHTAQITAFNRLRVSDARLLGEYRYMYGSGTTVEVVDKTLGTGILVKDQPRNCYLAQVGTDSGALAIRQTRQYHPYITGTSNIGMLTFTMSPAKVGLQQSVGLFDDDNGFIFRVRDNVAELVIRKSGVDNEVVPQSQWNGDRFDGTKSKFNASGVLADWSKSQILIIDYQWLGIGKVRFCFYNGDDIIVAHTFYHANAVTEVYTNNASFPCRWEIKNTGTTASPSTLMVICAAVYSEGSDFETGFSRSVSTDGTIINVTAANAVNGKGVLAVRMKNILEGKPCHAFARLKKYSVYATADINYKIVILPGMSAISGSPTWIDVPGYGWCEYIKDFTLNPAWAAGEDFQVICDDFAIGGQGNNSTAFTGTNIDNRSSSIFQNYDATDSQILAIVAYRLTNDSVVKASLSWNEIK